VVIIVHFIYIKCFIENIRALVYQIEDKFRHEEENIDEKLLIIDNNIKIMNENIIYGMESIHRSNESLGLIVRELSNRNDNRFLINIQEI
jgi:hypothetical protein